LPTGVRFPVQVGPQVGLRLLEWAMRHFLRTAFSAWVLCLGMTAVAQASDADVSPAASDTVTELEDWVVASGDNGGLPFVIIDKVHAKVFLFSPDGELKGSAPALLGLARGDDSVPGIGDRKLSAIRPKERTTPAGRFIAGFGRTPGEEDVLWVDYENAVSLHAVISASPKERRLARLQSPTAADNRITFGCINVPTAFYKKVVRPAFTGANGVVYVLPDTKALDEVFPAFRPPGRMQTAAAEPSTSAGDVSATAPAEASAIADEAVATASADDTTRRTGPD
jgi:hypothetical protein